MPQPNYNFRWFRDGADDSEIPAELLAAALHSAQRAFHYAGMIAEHTDRLGERLRARVPVEVARKYVLRCRPAIHGSYDVPTTLGYDELVDDDAVEHAAALFNAVVDAGRQISNQVLDELPADAVGRAFLLAVSGVVPPRGSGWSLEVRGNDAVSRVLTEDAHRRLEDLARLLEERPIVERGTLTGELRAIDFSRKQITILHLVDNRELECSYSVDEEISLINQRLSLVHVTGRLIRDASGRVSSIDEVDKIEPYDVSPIHVGRVDTSHGQLQLRRPLTLELQLDPDSNRQWMSVEYEALGLLVTAPTRGILVDALREEIAFLWEEYVMDRQTELSPGALSLRAELEQHFEVVANAAR
jgi:hypothetical protein